MGGDMSDLKVEFRAQRSMLQALCDTQQDHTARLTRIEDRLVKVEDRLGNVADRLGSVESALQLVRVGVETIHGKLNTLLARD